MSEGVQDGAGSCYQGPQLLGAESHILMLGFEWLAQRGNRNRGQDTWKNNPGCSGSIARTSNNSLSQKSVISKITGSRQDSRSSKARSMSLSYVTLKTPGILIRGGSVLDGGTCKETHTFKLTDPHSYRVAA